MEHIVKMRGSRVHDIHSRDGDLSGHAVTARSQNIDHITIKWDDSWRGYPQYSVIFYRSDTAPHKEYLIDYDCPTVTIPASLTEEPGRLYFTIKALDPTTGARKLSEKQNACFHVTESGYIDGLPGNEDQLTQLEETLASATDITKRADEAAKRAEAAARAAEGVGAMDYEMASNRPYINGTEVIGRKGLPDYGVDTCSIEKITQLFK